MSQSKSLRFVGNAFDLEKQSAARPSKLTMWTRQELDIILSLYGRHVADGLWRDYGIDAMKDLAVFSIFKRAHDHPLYRIEKNPSLHKRQGMYALVNSHGHVLKRGHDLTKVLKAIKAKKGARGKGKKAQVIRAF